MRTRRLRCPTLLVVGCGDVALRVLRELGGRCRVLALLRDPARRGELRAAGATPIVGDLDAPGSLARLAGLAARVLHLAPPPGAGGVDRRTAALLAALARRSAAVRRLVYVSTTGVYGDAGGARFDETRPTAPATARARRRVDAEQRVRRWALRHGVTACVLRVPGIYAPGRAGGDPRERLARGLPVPVAHEDVYTNHIHADDLARACIAALWRAAPQRVVHVCDDSELTMGAYFDLVADLAGLPRPPRLPRAAVEAQLGATAASFMRESRRLVNRRLKDELRLVLRYPRIADGLAPPSRV